MVATAVAPPRGVFGPRFRSRHPLLAQLAAFVLVSGSSTLLYALSYLLLRTWWDTMPANLTALLLSTLMSTEANRRFTFGGSDVHRWRAHLQTVGVVTFYAVYSSAVLLIVHLAIDDPTPLQESAAVAAASVLGGCARFLLLRFWVLSPDDLAEHPTHAVAGSATAPSAPRRPARPQRTPSAPER